MDDLKQATTIWRNGPKTGARTRAKKEENDELMRILTERVEEMNASSSDLPEFACEIEQADSMSPCPSQTVPT